LLGFGIADPFLNYGVQLVAAPSFPGVSLMGTRASDLLSAVISVPFVLAEALWKLGAYRTLKVYFAARTGRLLVMLSVMTMMIGLNTHNCGEPVGGSFFRRTSSNVLTRQSCEPTLNIT
jgi:hypothetical protein